MKKVYLILCFTILITIISGCDTNDETNNNTNHQLILSNENNFRLELLEVINEYKSILKLIVAVQEKSSNDYLEGRIDGFLSRNNQTIYSIFNQENIDETTLNAIVRKGLQKPLSQFVGLMTNSLTDIKKIGVHKLNSSDINKYDIVLSKLDVFDYSPSDIFTNESSAKEIISAIDDLIDMDITLSQS
ncbi:hypothetical protein M6D81_26580 [Paenibacillus sp. J5C_2022]|uniref:hypothetical protein n=1 Tax=Paenibacillus sp. J5C2022 TaxID=2977129 RepID=UPI0021D16E07|nr:hypothetical protein [Paenibacillus sp. J5C2022]MCU6712273.1 hypothetical protein [Paenibacillus sp. J5C2022]